jgi:putative sigma-54 modulation protein
MNAYAECKLAHLEHYLPDIDTAALEFTQQNGRGSGTVIAQLTIRHAQGVILRAEERAEADVRTAFDSVVAKIERQISRFKGRRRARAGARFADLEPALAAAATLPDEAEPAQRPTIVRRKRIEIAPMSEEEAAEQMELLGHDLFVFFNMASRTVNVLYRRKDGDYGLIDPVLA